MKPGVKLKTRYDRLFNLFYIPSLLLVLFFVAYPFANAFWISLHKWNGYSKSMTYIGFSNYRNMFGSGTFHSILLNTVIYGFGSTIIDCALGLALALFLNMDFPGRNIVRTIIYLPVLISNLVMGYVMYFIFQYNHGALNDILLFFGMQPIDWLSSKEAAVTIIVLVNSWQFVGNSMIIFLAGLQGIPIYYREAARIDGAGSIQVLLHITLPLLTPSTASAITLNLIGGLKLYELIVSLTGGGPAKASHSLSTYIANEYFSSERAGFAAALGIFSFLFIMLVANLANGYFRRKERKQQ